MNLKDLLGEKFKSDTILSDEERLDKKIKYLGLTQQDISRIKKLPFEKPIEDYSHLNTPNSKLQIVNVDDIVGTLRYAGDSTNWYDYMDKYVNKLNTYQSYYKNKASFQAMLIDSNQDSYPTLTKIGNSYYIKESGDGNHRITIAKCIGAQKVVAIVYE